MSLVALKPRRTVTPHVAQPVAVAVARRTVAAAPRADAFEAPKKVSTVQSVTDPNDWHLPSLDEVFELARRYPNKPIFLDLKLPADNPAVAKRMAQQLMEVLRKYPDMKDRVIVGLPNRTNLDAIKQAFSESRDFESFKNFTFDHEELNVVGTGEAPHDAHPLWGSGDNRYVSIGDPKTPGSKGDWDDLIRMSKDTLKQASDPKSPHYGKKLIVWTVNDEEKIRELAKLGVHGIMTDDPDLANRILDSMYSKTDPRRPKVMCHRGGPDDGFAPENTLPMIERGLQKGDAIEIDLMSCTDGIALFHDNDACDLIGTVRNMGLENDNFRPTNPGIFDSLRGKPAHELSIAELRRGYGYQRTWPEMPFQSSKSPFIRGVGRVLGTVRNGAIWVGRALAALGLQAWEGIKSFFKPLGSVFSAVGGLFKRMADNLGITSMIRGLGNAARRVGGFFVDLGRKLGVPKLVKAVGNAVTQAVDAVGNGIKKVGKAIGGFFKKLFG